MITQQTMSIKYQIDEGKQGRTQRWIVGEMCKRGFPMTEVQFSNKKKGIDGFTDKELAALSKILGKKINKQ